MTNKSKLLQFFAKQDPYQPGREVFFIDQDGNEATGNVTTIHIGEADGKLSLSYDVQTDAGIVTLHGSQVFDTKKDLRA